MPPKTGLHQALELIEHDNSKLLGLQIDQKPIPKGTRVPRNEAKSLPKIAFEAASTSATYVAIALDPDALTPTFNFLSPILHWIQPGLKASSSGATLTSTDPVAASYISPSPPPVGNPHRYVFLLYEQPEGFDVRKLVPTGDKPLGTLKRMNYKLDKLVSEAGLSQPVAANYFTSR